MRRQYLLYTPFLSVVPGQLKTSGALDPPVNRPKLVKEGKQLVIGGGILQHGREKLGFTEAI